MPAKTRDIAGMARSYKVRSPQDTVVQHVGWKTAKPFPPSGAAWRDEAVDKLRVVHPTH
ncbi:hypothetical protein D3C78_1517850 [compost metagenome]